MDQPLIAINLGLSQFAASLEDQEVEVVNVNWTPPAGGDEEMMDLWISCFNHLPASMIMI